MSNSGQNKPALIFFGNERIATGTTTTNPVLRMLLAEGYDIKAIVLHHTFGSSRNERELEVLEIAKTHNIPVLYPTRVEDINNELLAMGAEAGILVAFGKIVPESTIKIFPYGIINIHPSALPKHRGPTPVESVILDGSKETSVSVMALSKEMDAGPVYAQSPVTLSSSETKQELADILLEVSAKTLGVILPKILDGTCVAMPQDHEEATYDSLINKHDGTIDPSKPAAQLEREVRAFYEWPKSKTQLAGVDVIITKAHVVESTEVGNRTTGDAVVFDTKQLGIVTSDGILAIDELKPAGKKAMTSVAFLNGYGKSL